MPNPKPQIGVVALARPTFDIPYAEQVVQQAWNQLVTLDADLIGSSTLLFDTEAAQSALAELKEKSLDLLLILQISFTDATMTVEFARELEAPLALWSFPEPREGGRLRLNALCGINLAGHALGKQKIPYDYIHRPADSKEAIEEIQSLARANTVIQKLKNAKIGVIGKFPDGFDTCDYDKEGVAQKFGVGVEQLDLHKFLDGARAIPDTETDSVYQTLSKQVNNINELEQEPLRKSLKVYSNLKKIAADNQFQALAVRCWPEFFTDYGCAACGAMAMMNEQQIPCGCEADLYGTMTTLILQWLGNQPAFMADLVDVNVEEDTAVLWHCGLAPISMADPQKDVRATIHTNRKKPLLYEFTLKPGQVTIARLSQSQNKTRLVLGSGEMLQKPMSFTGTSGVIRFSKPSQQVLDTIMAEGLEHHFSLIYGDFQPALRKIAKRLGIELLELT